MIAIDSIREDCLDAPLHYVSTLIFGLQRSMASRILCIESDTRHLSLICR